MGVISGQGHKGGWYYRDGNWHQINDWQSLLMGVDDNVARNRQFFSTQARAKATAEERLYDKGKGKGKGDKGKGKGKYGKEKQPYGKSKDARVDYYYRQSFPSPATSKGQYTRLSPDIVHPEVTQEAIDNLSPEERLRAGIDAPRRRWSETT